MKKIFALLMAMVLVFGIAGCGSSSDSAMLTDEGAEDYNEDAGIIIFDPDVPLIGEPGSEDIHDYVFAVVDLVNAERAKENIAPVTLNRTATEAAQVRAAEAKQSFSHTRPDGSRCFTALADVGMDYMAAGENLAGRIKTPEKVVQAWMDSPSHKKNIMNPKYSQIGIGYVADGNYWSQFFVG